MKMTFRGWGREVYPHAHYVLPVKNTNNRFSPMHKRKSLLWFDGTFAYGKVHDLALSGDFLVEFQFTEAELRSWLTKYFESDPKAAQELVSKVQTDAIRKLLNKTGND